MANKRPASMKPKKSISDERTPEEYFDEAKLGLLAIVDSCIRNATRPDNVVGELTDLKSLDNNASLVLAYTIIREKKDMYVKVKDILESLTFDKISADNWEDPFADTIEYVNVNKLIPFVSEEFEDLMIRYAHFEAVRPFGEKVENLRMTILEKMSNK